MPKLPFLPILHVKSECTYLWVNVIHKIAIINIFISLAKRCSYHEILIPTERHIRCNCIVFPLVQNAVFCALIQQCKGRCEIAKKEYDRND